MDPSQFLFLFACLFMLEGSAFLSVEPLVTLLMLLLLLGMHRGGSLVLLARSLHLASGVMRFRRFLLWSFFSAFSIVLHSYVPTNPFSCPSARSSSFGQHPHDNLCFFNGLTQTATQSHLHPTCHKFFVSFPFWTQLFSISLVSFLHVAQNLQCFPGRSDNKTSAFNATNLAMDSNSSYLVATLPRLACL